MPTIKTLVVFTTYTGGGGGGGEGEGISPTTIFFFVIFNLGTAITSNFFVIVNFMPTFFFYLQSSTFVSKLLTKSV